MRVCLVASTIGLQAVDYLVVMAYMAALIGVGVVLARRQRTTEQFFVADREMPWYLVGISMLATLMSTLTYLGLPGDLIKNGMAIAVNFLAGPLAFFVIGFIWLPFYMRLGLTSAYEYLERRFGFKTRMFGVALYLYMRFVWLGAILYTMSSAVATMTQDTGPRALAELTAGTIDLGAQEWFYAVLIFTGLISTTYTALGGIKGLIWVDFMHFSVLLIGAIVTLVVIAWRTGTGPVDWWNNATSVAHEPPKFASWDLTEPRTLLWTLLGGFIWQICTHASDQVALQLYFTTSSAKNARRSALVNYVLEGSMAILLVMVGMALLTFYHNVPSELPGGVNELAEVDQPDAIFPHFIAHSLPVGLAGLVIAGIFAVAQSSIDSGINSTATVITVDLIRKFHGGPTTERGELALVRGLTFALGFLVTAIAVGISFGKGEGNIIDLQMRSFNCVLGPLGAIFMAGILLPHVGQRAVLVAGALGALHGLLLGYGGLLQLTIGQTVYRLVLPSSMLVIPLSWLTTFLLAAFLGSLFPPPTENQLQGLTWVGSRRERHNQQ